MGPGSPTSPWMVASPARRCGSPRFPGRAGDGTIRAPARSASPRRRASRSTFACASRMPGWRGATISARSPPALSHRQQRVGRADLGRARPRRGPLPDRPPGRGRGAQLAGVRRRGEPLPTAEPAGATAACRASGGSTSASTRTTACSSRAWAWNPNGTADLRVQRHHRDARDRRQCRVDPRHAGPRRPPLPARPRPGRPSPARARPTRTSISPRPATSTASRSASTSRAARTTRRSPSPPRPACRRTRSSRASCSEAR